MCCHGVKSSHTHATLPSSGQIDGQMKPPTVIMKPSLCRSRARGSPLLIVSLPVIGHTCQPVITVGVAGRRVVM